MILISGATGTIGSELVRQLAARGVPVRAMTRDPGRMQPVAGVDVVQGDFDDAESLRKATAGMAAVFLLSPPGGSAPEHDLAMLRALDGVRKVVKLSAIGLGGAAAEWHQVGEAAVRESGVAWTLLRPTGFASNALRWLPALQAGQPIPNLTGSGTHAFVDPRDVAAVAAEALLSSDHDGQLYTLSGPEFLSVPDQVAQLSEVIGRELTVVDVPIEIAAEQLRASGVDELVVSTMVKGTKLIRSGAEKTITTDVQRVLGRPAGTFRGWLERHREAFA
ncbi:NAD(P)H-binding protein [Kribbella sp. NPDC058245]|uniref:NAD(P)H-binding protein n=1 Tax=Kribbella sp. NPDC058245 TaxID=3346399 RepID=UPI0036EE1A15